MKKISLSAFAEIATHVLVWLFIFTSPLFFNHDLGGIDIYAYLRGSLFPMTLFIVFYTNYFILVPKMFMYGSKRNFFIADILLIVAVSFVLQEALSCFPPAPHHIKGPHFYMPPRWLFIARDTATMLLAAGFALTIRLSNQWRKAESARKEAEIGKREAELKNLRNQINPHFLLNTLNNIYALTTFDSKRAQSTIQELSRLLRSILYENQEEFTTLSKEADFLKSYVNLMRIRIPKTVDLKIDFTDAEHCSMPIAPLIFISIVENAFKHGISATENSFIHISLKVCRESGTIDFFCENSNFPKKKNDLSGNGVGLKGVDSRLKLIYPGRYTWEKGTNKENTVYTSHLIININNK